MRADDWEEAALHPRAWVRLVVGLGVGGGSDQFAKKAHPCCRCTVPYPLVSRDGGGSEGAMVF